MNYRSFQTEIEARDWARMMLRGQFDIFLDWTTKLWVVRYGSVA